ncbi:Short chain dehydrogenase asqE [Colletotrichum sp. SAR11_59]|nr:Short chain dehydrogenase asqE [Colletotrichum sp. SAR11_59]
MMDYSDLSSSYKRYKLKTAEALDWLVLEASKLKTAITSPRQYKVWELVDLAIACANAGRVMPKETRKALEESLCLRRRCAEWFLQHGSEAANATHTFFNESLQKILDAFAHPKPEATRPFASPPTSKPSSATPSDRDTSQTNYFAVLADDDDVHYQSSDEEVSAGFSTGNDATRPDRAAIKKTSRAEHCSQETEQSGWVAFDDDQLMELGCLLKDCRDIRLFLQRLWTGYSSSKVDLVTAWLVTQAGFQHLVDLETVFIQKYPYLDNLESMSNAMYCFCGLGQSSFWPDSAAEGSKRWDDKTLRNFDKKLWLSESNMKDWLLCDVSFMLEDLDSESNLEARIKDEPWSLPEIPLFQVKGLELRRLYDLQHESLAAGKSVVCLDLLTSRLVSEPSKTAGSPVRLSTAARCRTYLDILNIPDLMLRVTTDLVKYLNYRPLQDARSFARLMTQAGNEVTAWQHYRFALLHGSGGKPFIQNPILLGGLLCSVSVTSHLAETFSVSYSGSLMAVAHQYNALRILSLDTVPRWKDLEVLIELQKAAIFAPEPPQTFDQCIIRFWRSQGLRLSEIRTKTTTADRLALAAQRVVPLHRHLKQISKTDLTPEDITKGLNFHIKCESQRNTFGFRRELRGIPLLEHLFYAWEKTGIWKLSLSDRVVRSAVEADLGKLRGSQAGSRPLSAVDLPAVVWLGQLQKMFQRETPEMFFDYAYLERRVINQLCKDSASSDHVARFFENPDRGLSQWMSHMSNKSNLAVVSDHWKAWCKELGMVIPSNIL